MKHRVREIRIAKDVTQENLARAVGVTLGAIRKIERGGGLRLDTADRIAKALGVKVDDLMNGSGS